MRYSLLFLCMLAIPLATAAPAQIIDPASVVFTSPYIDSQNYTKANEYIPATITFNINESYNLFYLRLGTLNDRNEDILVNRGVCGDMCSRDIELKLTASSSASYVDTQFSIIAENGDTQTLNKRFRVDTVKPVLRSIGTETCQANCAVRTGPNRIVAYFQETGSGMDRSTTYLLTPTPVQATSCTANTCTFMTSVSGDDEVEFSLNAAKDKAGNSISGVTTTSFIVDNENPVIESVTTNPDRGSVVTGPFELRILFTDTTAVIGTAELVGFNNTPSMINLTCNAERCVARIVPKVGSYEASARINITDAAGNSVETTRAFTVSRVSTASANLWNVGGTVSPARLEKGTAKLFSKKFFVPVTYMAADGYAERRHTTVQQCYFYSNGEELADIPLTAEMLAGTTDTPVIAVTLEPSTQTIEALDDLSGTIRLRCEIQTFSTVDGLFYERGEQDNVTVNIRLVETPLVSSQYDQMLADAEEEYARRQQQLDDWQRFYRFGFTYCGAIQSVRGSQVIADTGAGAAAAIPAPPAQAAARGLDATGDTVRGVGDAMERIPQGHKLCAALACEAGGIYGSERLLNGMITPLSGHNNLLSRTFDYSVAATGSSASLIDPYKSEYIAYATACIPAITYHWQTKQSFACMYRSCMKDQVPSGLPISACEAQRSNQLCRYTTGALFYASPMGPLQVLRDNFITLVGNPYALGGFLSPALCAATGSSTNVLAKTACKIPNGIKQIAGIRGIIANMQQYGALMSSSSNDLLPQACQTPTQPLDPLARTLARDVQCNAASCCYGGYCMYGGNYYRVNGRSTQIAVAESESTGHTLERANERSVPAEVRNVIGNADVVRRTTFVDSEYQNEMRAVVRIRQDIAAQRRDIYRQESRLNNALGPEGTVTAAMKGCNNLGAAACAITVGDSLRAAGVAFTPEQQELLAQGLRTQYEAHSTSVYGTPGVTPWELDTPPIAGSGDPEVQREQEEMVQGLLGQVVDGVADDRFEELDGLQEAQDRREREVNNRRRDADQDLYRRSLDNPYMLVTEMGTTGIAAFQVASMIGQNHAGVPGIGNIEELDASLHDFEKELADNVCTDKMLRREPNIIGLGEGHTIGMYVHGTRTDLTRSRYSDSTETAQYQYLIGGQISVPDATEGMFTIYLKGSDPDEPLFEGDFGQRTTFSWADASLISAESNSRHTDVCVKFQDITIQELFADTNYEGDEVCVPLTELDE